MSTVLERRPHVNPLTRPIASLTGASLYEHGGLLRLQLVTGHGNRTAAKWYAVERIPSDFGEAFRLTPTMGDTLADGESYDVLLDGDNTSCSCAGHAFTGGCKHLSALIQFKADGRL